MKESPIIFSSKMVKAILEGRKTLTRRVIKPQPEPHEQGWVWSKCEGMLVSNTGQTYLSKILSKCPYGQPGDRLWVKETFRTTEIYETLYYKADEPWNEGKEWSWNSSRYMPRWASRITLEITNIRVERLQEISLTDVILEGFIPSSETYQATEGNQKQTILDWGRFWDSLSIKRGFGWDINPWVWVIEFKKL